MQPNRLRGQSEKWPKAQFAHNGIATYAHDIDYKCYFDAFPLRPFHGYHPRPQLDITRDLLRQADPNLFERAERDGYAAPDARVKFLEAKSGMNLIRYGPEYGARAFVYDVGGIARVQHLLHFEAHYGPLMMEIHVIPTCGMVGPPDVLSNEARILLQSPEPGESVIISVKWMAQSGNILIQEITDPDGVVLEARSGRFYPPAQISNEEFLCDPEKMRHAENQAQYSRTQRDMLERAKLMREMNNELNPPQAPALVLHGFRTREDAEQAQGFARHRNPPTSSASAHTQRSNRPVHAQHRASGSGGSQPKKAKQVSKKDQEFMSSLSGMKRAKEAVQMARCIMNRERRASRAELKKKREQGDKYVPPKSASVSPPRKYKSRKGSSGSSSSSSSDSEGDKEMPDEEILP
jgi:hypothetical protein